MAAYRVVDTYERLGRQSDVLREDQDHLRLEMDPAAMSRGERMRAEAALRQALERLASRRSDS